ncbi:MAG: efflux RND transporter periplasmic adaptor subunit [Candidatus Obscuribacterales bacterium]|nr:efflux RND transporter periplasmic adaptor subunit [Candidatus Obscuribacterales bacterium]
MSRKNVAVTLTCLSATLILTACEGGKSEVADPSGKNGSKTYSFDVNEHASDRRGAKVASENIVELDSDAQKLADLQAGDAAFRLLNISVKTTGEVLANANLMTHVTTPVTGRITQIFVSIGDHIADGKRLLEIRSTDIEQAEADLLQNENQVTADLKRDLLQVDTDLATSQAQVKLSESTFNRMKNLVDEKIASRADFEAARTGYEKDKITVDALQRKRDATISLAKERLKLLTEPSKSKLRLLGITDSDIAQVMKTHEVDPLLPVLAPEAGVISERLVNVGELVDPTKPLITIGDYHNVWIKADVYEKDLAKVREGQPIELELDSFPGEKFAGKLDYVSSSLDADNRTLTVRAQVPNPSGKLKPKMFARMKILVGEHRVLTIPKSAVQDAGTEKVVYIPAGQNKFIERQVKLGDESGDNIEVLQGLKPGDRVVTKGSFELRSESMHQTS